MNIGETFTNVKTGAESLRDSNCGKWARTAAAFGGAFAALVLLIDNHVQSVDRRKEAAQKFQQELRLKELEKQVATNTVATLANRAVAAYIAGDAAVEVAESQAVEQVANQRSAAP